MQVAKWNYNRKNTNLDIELELNMLNEEAQEFKDGMALYFDASTPEEILEAKVELIDAWADYKFVLQGTTYKALGTSLDLNGVRNFLYYMQDILIECKIPSTICDNAYKAVIAANGAKGTEKVDGKIQKGKDWVDPKEVIRGLLDAQ